MGFNVVAYCISNLFRIYISYKAFRIFFSECKVNLKKEMLIYVIYWIVNSFVYLVICIPLCTILTNVLFLIAITLFYKGTIRRKIFAVFSQYVIFTTVEILVILVFYQNKIGLMKKNDLAGSIEYVIGNISAYPVVLTLEKHAQIRKGEEVPKLYWFLIVILPISTILMLLTIYNSDDIPAYMIFVCACIAMLINIITFTLYDLMAKAMGNRVNETRIVEQNKSYEAQIRILEESLYKTRVMRHDWKNMLGVIVHFTRTNQIERLKQYINELLDRCDEGAEFCRTGNLAVDAIVNYKCEEAKKGQIKVELNLEISKEIRVQSLDISAIIGNLMDNAIRALKDVTYERKIVLTVKQNQNQIMINVTNPYESTLAISNGNYATTKQDKANHGIGLTNVKNIAEKYNGAMNIVTENKIFDVNIILFEQPT